MNTKLTKPVGKPGTDFPNVCVGRSWVRPQTTVALSVREKEIDTFITANMSVNNLSVDDGVIEVIKRAVLENIDHFEGLQLQMVADLEFTNRSLCRILRRDGGWSGYGGLYLTYFENLSSEILGPLQNVKISFEVEEQEIVVPLITALLFLYDMPNRKTSIAEELAEAIGSATTTSQSG